MPAITFANDAANPSHTIVNVLWSTGECIQYTIIDNGDSAHVWQTGYACPEDDVALFTWEPGEHGMEPEEFATVADAIEFCCDCHG